MNLNNSFYKSINCQCKKCSSPVFKIKQHSKFEKINIQNKINKKFICFLLCVNILLLTTTLYFYDKIFNKSYTLIAKSTTIPIIFNFIICLLTSHNYHFYHIVSFFFFFFFSLVHVIFHLFVFFFNTNNLLPHYIFFYISGFIILIWLFLIFIVSVLRKRIYKYFIYIHYSFYFLTFFFIVHSPIFFFAFIPFFYRKIKEIIILFYTPKIKIEKVYKQFICLTLTYKLNYLTNFILVSSLENYCYIICKNISNFEHHVFTITSIKKENKYISYEIIISNNGDWKNKLHCIALSNFDFNFYNNGLNIKIVKFRENNISNVFSKFDNIVFVLENIGITTFFSSLNLFLTINKLQMKKYNITLHYKFDFIEYYEILLLKYIEYVKNIKNNFNNIEIFLHTSILNLKTHSLDMLKPINSTRMDVNEIFKTLENKSNENKCLKTCIIINNNKSEFVNRLRKKFNQNRYKVRDISLYVEN